MGKRSKIPKEICPDYEKHPEECRTKLGVMCCCILPEHKGYRCPIVDYSSPASDYPDFTEEEK